MEIFVGILQLGFFLGCAWIPSWWMAGRLDDRLSQSAMRFPASIGLALVFYLSIVNLLGKLLQDSILSILIYLILNIIACVYLLLKRRNELGVGMLAGTARSWVGVLVLASILSLPQMFHALSGNRWDEMASSAIHITAPNQFSEGVFPPRHNAFPDIVVKYHYGFVLLSGAVRLLTGLSATFSVDVASSALWLFTFIFAFGWLRQLGARKLASFWGSFAILLGGGLSWLYLTKLRVYEGFKKWPSENALAHSYDSGMSWWDNAIAVFGNQNVHLANKAGELFPLPFDISVHYQQHAVATGIAISLVAAYMFWLWQTRKGFSPILLAINCLCFGLVFLSHAVLGAVSSVSAGLTLAVLWLLKPDRIRFFQGILFTAGVAAIAFLHGGMLAGGSEYGPPGAPITMRSELGYVGGNLLDLVNWSLAGFGLLLVLSMVSVWAWIRRGQGMALSKEFLVYFGLFAFVSFMVPQLFYFSHAGGIEEQTEISKFFFGTHLGLALFSVAGFDYLCRRVHGVVLLPIFVLSGVTPVISSVAGGLNDDGGWDGIYRSPYAWEGGRSFEAAGQALYSLKEGNTEQYFDFSTREVSSGYLNELLVYGGSVFSLSATRYEVTGFGFLIAEDVAAERIMHESRMARLLPGAAEASSTDWLYLVTKRDLARRPPVVRSRFRKMVAEGILADRYSDGERELYRFVKATGDIDSGLEMYWTPKIISQTNADWDGDGRLDLIFYDYKNQQFMVGEERIPLPEDLRSLEEVQTVFLVRLPGDDRIDLLVGYMSDAIYFRGKSLAYMVRKYPFVWHRLDSTVGRWQSHQNFSWMLPLQNPVVADPENDGVETLLAYQPNKEAWTNYSHRPLEGPSLPEWVSPLPVFGKFTPGSVGDLALWSPVNGQFELNTPAGEVISFEWGGLEGDILLPGDFNGDGIDEVGIWQPHSLTWWIRDLSTGENRGFIYGTPSGIPLPADYNFDGILDLAFWEPSQNTIFVSFDFGESNGATISVPPNSIPVYVNMY
jgi:hypothetical protein